MLNHVNKSLFILLAISLNTTALEYVPEVYEDDYIVVRSGIAEAGRKPVNLGDKMSLIIEAEFSGNEVIIENLDEQLFERSWGSEKGINLIASPEVDRAVTADGTTLVRSTFHFQILDCPGDLTSCRGNKYYELPVFTVGYQIIDGGGNVVNNKSIRFNPVPSSIVVMQALDIRGEGGLEELSAYLGNNGYPTSMPIADEEAASVWPVMTGGIIFLASFLPLLFTSKSPKRSESKNRLNSRWENVLAHATNDSNNLSDEEWSDMLRRCATWYSLDQLGENPYTWVGKHEADLQDNEFKKFFIDVLNQESIPNEERENFINRFNSITSAG
ncbi:MAG: hypothetical protein HKN08_03655 [Gammaproteobacteria bacterium]|nr:hypothetical protein [Gammaproteobacteria bacterium]